MDCDEDDNSGVPSAPGGDKSRSAVNSLILDYYKKFGRKRDLEQYFSLSTAQSDIRDPSSVFWARMKTENESSDSGERSVTKSESSQELCRISIRFPAQDPYISQEEVSKAKTESVSPPIIIEEAQDSSRQNSEDEANKSDDNNSQQSYDVLLDTSLNKPHSPSSSITSQRKLEWDSLADVGYANESDRKTSASSLSTLERLALKQQYSNNDTQDNKLGPPTAHSTPLDENEPKSKNKKGVGKKTTKIYKKDVDFLEVNVPHSSNMNPAQSINVNLTKHISFNVEKDGKVTVDNVQKDVSVSPEKVTVVTEVSPQVRIDKEIQTSLTKTKEINVPSIPANSQSQPQRIPVLISLNTLRTRVQRKKLRRARRKLKSKKRSDKENIPVKEKSGDQPSEAESFEYMPGHIYNQNQLTANNRPPNPADNKSSLESSRVATTDSSKGSKHSFAKDLEKSIDVLKAALQQHCDDSALRKQLIKQVCQRLLKSKYRDDDSTTDFLSGLSYSSQKLGLGERNNTTTSTSDANNSTETSKRPQKSILRSDKFNPGSLASTSQSVPNLPVASKSDNLVTSKLVKNLTASNTDSDISSKEKTSSDNGFARTSAEELYKKYLQAYKKEEAYKRHLKDKEMFLKQKLVSSDNAFKIPLRPEVKHSNKLKDLINDLTRNNYDDGSGDASKLEGGPGSNRDFDRYLANRNQRSHSVFTLSSGNSDRNNKQPNLRKRLQCNIQDLSKPGPSKEHHYCCCPHHTQSLKFGVTDSSVQATVNNPCNDATCSVRHINLPKKENKEDSSIKAATAIADEATGQIKYVCLCSNKDVPENLLIYKCSRVTNKGIQIEEVPPKSSDEAQIQCCNQDCTKRNTEVKSISKGVTNKSSQTNMLMKMLHQSSSDPSVTCSDKKNSQNIPDFDKPSKEICPVCTVCEATRCVQTDISINPKISDPTLSDIVIVSESDCAKLISERRRELSKPSILESKSCQPDGSSQSAKSGSCKSSGTSKDVDIELLEEDNPADVLDTEQRKMEQIESQKVNKEHSENFTIPIHGTNMTLMVSIGSERPVANNNKIHETANQSEGTDNVNIIEQATCLTEECSKSLQVNNADNDFESSDHNSNKIEQSYKNGAGNIMETVPISNFDTYPKSSLVNERKPFRRCNTETDKIGVQTDIVKKNNVATQEKVPMETQTENLSRNNICKCGCLHNKSSCSVKCSYNKDNSASSSKTKTSDASKKDSAKIFLKNKILLPKKDAGSKNDQSTPRFSRPLDKQNEKCLCGFGGPKNACRNTCPDSQSSLGQQRKLYLDRDNGSIPCNKNNDSEKHSVKCLCGCEGTKDNCMKYCKELNPTALDKRRTSLGKRTCGKKGFPNDQEENCNVVNSTPRDRKNSSSKGDTDNEPKLSTNQNRKYSFDKNECGNISANNKGQKCFCGCSGTKDNCNEDCIELKSTPRETTMEYKELLSSLIERKASSDKNECGKRNSDGEEEECSCGCDGTKNNCKESCSELKSALRENKDPSWGKNKEDIKEYHSTPSTPRGNDFSRGKNKENGNELQQNSKLSQGNTCGTINANNQGDKCLCGCGGTKDNCKEDCVNLNLHTTTREQQRKQSVDYRVYTAQQHFPDLAKDQCPCGCGGTKDNCREDCSKSEKSPRCLKEQTNKKEVGTQKHLKDDESPRSSEKHYKDKLVNRVNSRGEQTDIGPSSKYQQLSSEPEQIDLGSDPILDIIQSITKKYSKKNIEKGKRKKCFKEIMTVLSYLLDTDESNDDRKNMCESTSTTDETDTSIKKMPEKNIPPNVKKISEKTPSENISRKLVDKGVQLSAKKFKTHRCMTESSELPVSTDMPGTSSESNTCKVLNKIKKECERYHQKRCKIHSGKKCDPNCVTSVNCDHCRRVHHCPCRNHKCYKKSNEKINKTPVAYNLILQTSESVVSEGTVCGKTRQLKNIIVKVPKKKGEPVPFREMAAKFERNIHCSIPCPPYDRPSRSRSLPNDSEISSIEDIIRKSQGATVREYLERNRPDFVERCSQRQSCLKYINESRCQDSARPSLKMIVVHTPNCTGSCKTHCRGIANVPMTCISTQGVQPRILQTGVTRIANERAVKRDLLSLHLAQLPDVTDLDPEELRRLAKNLGRHMRQKQLAPKFISEREMKKHSEKIYKSLPEVVQKKEEKRKESIKKTNLLMAHIFKKNLQKKTLGGSVNLSNYSMVIKI